VRSDVEALVATGTPIRQEVQGFENVTLNQAAGPLAVNFVAAAVSTNVRRLAKESGTANGSCR
jgi:hypothetical protein